MALTEHETLDLVRAELDRATKLHGGFNSPHEGYAVLLEEVDELWHEIKHGKSQQDFTDEATQVAAMAIKLIMSFGISRQKESNDG